MKIMVLLTSRRVSLSISAFIRSSRCIYVFLSMLGNDCVSGRALEESSQLQPGVHPGNPPQEGRPSGLAGNCSLLRHQYDRLFVLVILCRTAHFKGLFYGLTVSVTCLFAVLLALRMLL